MRRARASVVRRLPALRLRAKRPAPDEASEREWCERYAASHVAVGVHGSNMLLPSAHAGAVVELLGAERWGNFAQGILFRDAGDCRETFFRYRFVHDTIRSAGLARLAGRLLGGRKDFQLLMNVRPTEAEAC